MAGVAAKPRRPDSWINPGSCCAAWKKQKTEFNDRYEDKKTNQTTGRRDARSRKLREIVIDALILRIANVYGSDPAESGVIAGWHRTVVSGAGICGGIGGDVAVSVEMCREHAL
jgi:hypothetical protein